MQQFFFDMEVGERHNTDAMQGLTLHQTNKNFNISERRCFFSLSTHSLIHHFETVPNSKKLQTRTDMWLLTLYHTIPTFNDPKEDGFGKHCGKRRKCWKPAFSPFTVFSALSTFNWSSPNAFNSVMSNFFSFGKGLKDFKI